MILWLQTFYELSIIIETVGNGSSVKFIEFRALLPLEVVAARMIPAFQWSTKQLIHKSRDQNSAGRPDDL